MTDDHRKRFNLSEGQPRKAFSLNNDQRPQVRDKDNTAHVIPPPRMNWTPPHPRLAPPGMMGARLAQDANRWLEGKRQREAEDRPFKPLAPERGKGWSRGR